MGQRPCGRRWPRLNIQQLNTEGLTASKLNVIEQVDYKNKALATIIQDTHYTTADKLVIPNVSLAGSVPRRKQGLATFVHEWLEWSLADKSPEKSETECLCEDFVEYKIISVYKAPTSRLTPRAISTLLQSSLFRRKLQLSACPLGMHHISWQWKPNILDSNQQPLRCCTTQSRSQSLFSLMEPRHQPGPGFREFRPRQTTARQAYSRNVPAVTLTTPTFSHCGTTAQSSCLHRTGEVLKLSQN